MTGSSLAHYQIEGLLGRGGMGEVYRAKDSKLGRAVALKLLPGDFASDTERLARFRREAKVLASLNHPNIAAVYGLESAEGKHFLVMELAEGENLDARIKKGRVPLEEALEIARQIAEGLGEAHEKGVVHRDLKPANIQLSPDGKVKILDFGLARAYDTEAVGEEDMDHSPTITAMHTQAGTILGTAAYMSPEQARGRPVDGRSDIWAFGVILFEMLTGKQMFDEETISDTLASILKTPPDFSLLPEETPARIRELLERCLAKHRRDRLQAIGDARLEIDWVQAGRTGEVASGVPAPAASRRHFPLVAGAVVVGALLGIGLWSLRPAGDPVTTATNVAGPRRVSVRFPAELRVLSSRPTPDGSAICIEARPHNPASEANDVARLYLRQMDDYEFRPVEGSADLVEYAFSPDGEWIAMIAPEEPGSSRRRLVKAPLDGSAPPLTLMDWPEDWGTALLWRESGDLVVSSGNRELTVVASDGSSVGQPVKIQAEEFADDFNPGNSIRTVLPGGELLSAVEIWNERGWSRNIAVADMNTGQASLLIENGANPVWSPTGHLLFCRGATLLAVPFDPAGLRVTGGPVAVADGVRTIASWGHGRYSLTGDGTLVYLPGGRIGNRRQLVWIDRDLRTMTPWSEERGAYDSPPRISPDGRYVAVTIAGSDAVFDTWLSEVDRPGFSLLVEEPARDCYPRLWAPDGKNLIYGSRTAGDQRFMMISVDTGERELLFENTDSDLALLPWSFADDGKSLLVSRFEGNRSEIVLHPMDGTADGSPPTRRVLANATQSRISPDGRWLLYQSDVSGRVEIYVRRWLGNGDLGPATRVSTQGGAGATWYRPPGGDPMEIWFGREGTIYKVTAGMEPELRLSRPQVVGEDKPEYGGMGFLPDGRILLRRRGEDEGDPTRVNLVLGWENELRRRLRQ